MCSARKIDYFIYSIHFAAPSTLPAAAALLAPSAQLRPWRQVKRKWRHIKPPKRWALFSRRRWTVSKISVTTGAVESNIVLSRFAIHLTK